MTATVPVSVSRRRSLPGAAPGYSPDGPLVDRFGRVHRDLRISITDRCNLRCVYCMPEDGVEFMARSEILTYEELTRVARVAHGLGVTRIRITGGEPLVRRGLESFVTMLAGIGFADISMTTNGIGFERRAQGLADAGLHRVNISCDSLRALRFAEIRRSGDPATWPRCWRPWMRPRRPGSGRSR
jgi:GTP 3',8-cyclase